MSRPPSRSGRGPSGWSAVHGSSESSGSSRSPSLGSTTSSRPSGPEALAAGAPSTGSSAARPWGPLGEIRGMYFDVLRNKYFPLPRNGPPGYPRPSSRSNTGGAGAAEESGSAAAGGADSGATGGAGPGSEALLMPVTGCVENVQAGKKRSQPGLESSSMPRAGPSRRPLVRRGREWATHSILRDHYASLRDEVRHQLSHCLGERVTSYKSMANGTYYATTDHGRVILHREQSTQIITVCAHSLVGLHADVARMTFLAIATGPEPHIHYFRRDPAASDHFMMEHTDLDLPHGNLFASSSYDDTCAIAAERSIIVVRYDVAPRVQQKRALPSDPLCLHQAEPNLLFAGLRSSGIHMEDLRVPGHPSRSIMSMPGGKAMVGIKRLRDSAVPWGLLASAMDNQLCVFDIRFGRSALLELEGHVNSYQHYLGLATSPDDKFIFAAGSDHRVRCWDSVTGAPVMPVQSVPRRGANPLSKSFEHCVQILDVRDDLGLDVVDKGELQRFGRASSR